MFTIYLTNFGYALNGGHAYATADEARNAGYKAGFEFTMLQTNDDGSKTVIGFWSPIGGWRVAPH